MTADPYEGRTKPAYDPRTCCWCCGWDHVLGLTPCGPTSGFPVGIITASEVRDVARSLRGSSPAHDGLWMDFLAVLIRQDGVSRLRAASLANELVHLVVLHGHLPDAPPATTENQA